MSYRPNDRVAVRPSNTTAWYHGATIRRTGLYQDQLPHPLDEQWIVLLDNGNRICCTIACMRPLK